jgi:hypothetical protein
MMSAMEEQSMRITCSRIIITLGALALLAPVSAAGDPLAEGGSTTADGEPIREHNTLTRAEKVAGWKLLFDGANTAAWRGFQQEVFPAKGWTVEDGCLRVVAGGGGGDIITVDKYENFEFSLDFRVSARANSGIMYRVTEESKAPWHTGPEFQILDDLGFNIKSTDAHSVGALYDLYPPVAGKLIRPAGEFNTARIVLDHDKLEHWLNGIKVLSCNLASEEFRQRVEASKFGVYESFGRRKNGHIALQDHGNDIWFRNIKIRNLSAQMPGEVKLFNGADLNGWTAHLPEGVEMTDVWSVRDAILICKGEPAGYLKTKATYESYVLMLDWRYDPATGKGGNSGVLLRVIGEDKVWPKSVEAQLMSGNAGDFWCIGEYPMQTVPERRKGRLTYKIGEAEHPVGHWNHYEIHVDGPFITLFVNGLRVNEAWDVAVLPGAIALQSEGAEIHYRDIRLAPIE